jgi:hypothetical protein
MEVRTGREACAAPKQALRYSHSTLNSPKEPSPYHPPRTLIDTSNLQVRDACWRQTQAQPKLPAGSFSLHLSTPRTSFRGIHGPG